MNYCVIVSLVLSVCCGLRGAALPEQPVRDIKRTKLYAAIYAKIQQHLLPPLAEKVAGYCDNDFPLVEQAAFVAGRGVCCAAFLNERYVLVAKEKSKHVTVIDLCSNVAQKTNIQHDADLTAVCHVSEDIIATGGMDGIVCIWDLPQQKKLWSTQFTHIIRKLIGFDADKKMLAVVDAGEALTILDVQAKKRRDTFNNRDLRDGMGIGHSWQSLKLAHNSDEGARFWHSGGYIDYVPEAVKENRFSLVGAYWRDEFEQGKISSMDDHVYCADEMFRISAGHGKHPNENFCSVYGVKEVMGSLDSPRGSFVGSARSVIVSPSRNAMLLITNGDVIRVLTPTQEVPEEKELVFAPISKKSDEVWV